MMQAKLDPFLFSENVMVTLIFRVTGISVKKFNITFMYAF